MRCVFGHLCVDPDVHFGGILASKTTPVSTPTRRGRPSILNNSPMKIKLFDPVGVAGGSRGRPLKRNTFYNEIRTPKCLQNDTEMDPKRGQNGIQKRCRNCSENNAKLYQNMLQNGNQNGARGGPKSCPGAPEGTPRAPGPPREVPWSPRDFILAAPEVPGTPFYYHFRRL